MDRLEKSTSAMVKDLYKTVFPFDEVHKRNLY